MAPMEYSTRVEKTLWLQRNIPSRFIALMEKVWFRSGNHHGKREKKYCMKDTMSIKISVMHYIKWTIKTIMLPVVFEEFEMVYTFLLLFSFEKVNFSKNLGGCSPPCPPPLPGFYSPVEAWVHFLGTFSEKRAFCLLAPPK